MSSHGHHHKKHRRRSPLKLFFDRLTGKKHHHTHHRSQFPGINLPEDYDQHTWTHDEVRNRSFYDSETEDTSTDSPQISPAQDRAMAPENSKPAPSRRRKGLFGGFKNYTQRRELRREERMKKKLRKRHHRQSQEQYRKMNKGPGLVKKLFKWSDTDEAEREKKVPLFAQKSPFYRNMTITVNSVMIFLLTYVLVYLFYWITCLVVASFYGLDSTLYFYDLKFNDHSPLWNRFNILLVTGIPPFVCLFAGVFLYKIIFKIKRFTGLQKLFILWTSFHLLNHFFGAFPSGIVTDEGFGYVAAWLYMNTAFKFLFSLVSLFALGVIGFYSARHILETSDSFHRIKGSNRLPFMLYQIAIPWFIGTLIMVLVRIPENFNYPYETLMLFSTVFLVIPPFFNEKVKPELNLLKIKKRRNINIGYLAMMLVMLAFLRITLGTGLHFLIDIHISISPAVA